jgi:NADH-quinone oxidoreductase subunit H
MAEYTAMIVTSAVAVTLFLGGWGLFGLESFVKDPTIRVFLGVIIFAAKVLVLIYGAMWFRWTFPRYRYDQLMDLGWKWLIPAGLANIVLTGVLYVLALPADQGGVFGFITREATGYVVTGKGVIYFFVTGFLVTIPIAWMMLAAINRRSHSFNLHAQRQLQIGLRRDRLQKTAAPQPAE